MLLSSEIGIVKLKYIAVEVRWKMHYKLDRCYPTKAIAIFPVNIYDKHIRKIVLDKSLHLFILVASELPFENVLPTLQRSFLNDLMQEDNSL